jgi:hypothetical protein
LEERQEKQREQEPRLAALAAYIPTHDDEAVMDGAPDLLGLVLGEKATATTKANAGVLRCAQNDGDFLGRHFGLVISVELQ